MNKAGYSLNLSIALVLHCVFALGATANSQVETPPYIISNTTDESLILHYTFDDDVGATVVDQSGNGNDGILANKCTYVDGINELGIKIHGNSTHIGSTGGHVLLPTLDINAMSEITVALWVKEEIMHHPHGEVYITIGSAPVDKAMIRISNPIRDGAFRFILGTEKLDVAYTAPLPVEFVHYAVTFSEGMMYAYRNGLLVGQTNSTLRVDHPQYAALGRSWWNNGLGTRTSLTAVYDDVRIYDRALAPSEVLKLYNSKIEIPFAGFSPSTTIVHFGDEAKTDHLLFSGSFLLSAESDGVDASEDELALNAGPFTIQIPIGLFQQRGPQYTWDGNINGARFKISLMRHNERSYSFSIRAHGINLDGWSNPEEWQLAIGNDFGMISRRLNGHLQSDLGQLNNL